MLHWLYKYIFRGIGIVFLAAMATALVLFFMNRNQMSPGHPPTPAAASHR